MSQHTLDLVLLYFVAISMVLAIGVMVVFSIIEVIQERKDRAKIPEMKRVYKYVRLESNI